MRNAVPDLSEFVPFPAQIRSKLFIFVPLCFCSKIPNKSRFIAVLPTFFDASY